MTSIKKEKGSVVSFDLTITEADVKKAEAKVLQKYQQTMKAPGFRPGKVPLDYVRAQMGMKLGEEALNKAMTDQYRDVLAENNIKPIAEPKIELEKMDKLPVKVPVKVEIYPEVNLPKDYMSLMGKVALPKIKKEEIGALKKKMVTDFGLATPVNRASKKGDSAIISFKGYEKAGGETLKGTDGKNQKYEVGSGQFLPELDKAMIGMKPGEKKEAIKVKFPKEYHSPDYAGKTILFDLEVHELKEADPSTLKDEDVAKMFGPEVKPANLDAKCEEMLQKRLWRNEREKTLRTFEEDVAKKAKIELPTSWLEAEKNQRMYQLTNNPEFAKDPEGFFKKIGTTQKKAEAEAEKAADIALQAHLVREKILEEEKIDITKEEQERIDKYGKTYGRSAAQLVFDTKWNKWVEKTLPFAA